MRTCFVPIEPVCTAADVSRPASPPLPNLLLLLLSVYLSLFTALRFEAPLPAIQRTRRRPSEMGASRVSRVLLLLLPVLPITFSLPGGAAIVVALQRPSFVIQNSDACSAACIVCPVAEEFKREPCCALL